MTTPSFPGRPVLARALMFFTIVAAPAPALAASETVELTAVVAFFLAMVVLAALALVGYHRRTIERHQTMRAMVEKGMEIPPRLLDDAPRNPKRDHRLGVLLICAGVGISLFLGVEDGPRDAAFGLVPILIGVGYLIVARAETAQVERVMTP